MVDYKKMTLGDIVSQIMFKDNIGEEAANSLKNKILDKEEYILNLSSNSEFGGVTANSITNKHNVYNLIDFKWPEVDLIIDKTKQMVKPFNINNEPLCMKMWANIYRKGEYIQKHNHLKLKPQTQPIATILFSGHCFLYSDVPTSTTFYFGPKEEENDVTNNVGEIDIFSPFIPHEFKPNQGELRVGIAFDFFVGTKMFKNINKLFRIV